MTFVETPGVRFSEGTVDGDKLESERRRRRRRRGCERRPARPASSTSASKDSGVFFFPRTFFSTHFSRLGRKLKVGGERKCVGMRERRRRRSVSESFLLTCACECVREHALARPRRNRARRV